MPLFLGLDAGGTSCRALAVNEADEVVFRGQSGAANVATTPMGAFDANMRKAVAGCPRPDVVCGCFAGLVGGDEKQRALLWLSRRFPDSIIRTEPDYLATLKAADEPVDMCVIAGTGSIVCSMTDDGAVTTGGRGYLLGDEGSAFRLGQRLLCAVMERPDLIGEFVLEAIVEAFGSTEAAMIVSRLYTSHSPPGKLASLAPIVLQGAAHGDALCVEIANGSAEALARVAVIHANRHFRSQNAVSVGLAGGLWKRGVFYRQAFGEALANMLDPKTVELCHIRRLAVYGAVALAQQLYGN